MTREILSRREFLQVSAGVVAAGTTGLRAHLDQQTTIIRITFSGLCYLCVPQGGKQSYVLMPRCGKGTAAGPYGLNVDLRHEAALFYDLAYEDAKIPSGKHYARVPLERQWLYLPDFPGTPPSLPKGLTTLQQWFPGLGPAAPTFSDPDNPCLPKSIASHVWLTAGCYEDCPDLVNFQEFANGKPASLPYEVYWHSPPTAVPVHLETHPYPNEGGVVYNVPDLSPLPGGKTIELMVLNIPTGEGPGIQTPAPNPNGYRAYHFAAFYDLFSSPGAYVGQTANPMVPYQPTNSSSQPACQPGPCQKPAGVQGRTITKLTYSQPFTCMISGGG